MDSPKLKDSLAFAACLFVIHLSLSCAHPVPSSRAEEVTGSSMIGRKTFNFQRVIRNEPTTTHDYQQYEIGANKKPFAPTTEAFSVTLDYTTINTTTSSINRYGSDAFIQTASDQTEEPTSTDMQDLAEYVTPFPVNREEFSEIVTQENHPANGLGNLLHDFDTVTAPSSTDISVDLPSLRSSVTPSAPQDIFHLQTSITMSPPHFSFTNDTSSTDGLRGISYNAKMLQEHETISDILANYLLPPAEDSQSQQTSIASFDPADLIPVNSTASPITVASAHVSTSKKADSSKQSFLSPEPVFNSSGNPASTTLSIEIPAFQRTFVENSYSFHPSIDMPTAMHVDIDPFPLNPEWPAKMGFHSYSAPEQPVTPGNKRSTLYTKIVPYGRILPDSQRYLPSYPGEHSFSPQLHPVQFRYRQPVSHGHPRAPYPHPHDNSNSIHRSFESAPRKSRMFAFPGVSSTRDNFRFRVNWVDEI